MLRAMSLSDEKYLRFTTFRKNGTPVATPVWVADIGDGRIGFWTSSGSGKAKRLAHTQRVTLQPSDGRGRVKGDTAAIEASAELVADGPQLEAIRKAIVTKYGFQTKVTKLLGTIGGIVKGKRIPYADRGVVITLPPTA
jgi:PPOX class probable F420-dependent enzyme